MLLVLVQVSVRAEKLAEFERAILLNAEAARTREPGCVRFDVSQREDDPTQWVFYEVYRSPAAFEAHRASPHFADYQRVADKALRSKTVTLYSTKN